MDKNASQDRYCIHGACGRDKRRVRVKQANAKRGRRIAVDATVTRIGVDAFTNACLPAWNESMPHRHAVVEPSWLGPLIAALTYDVSLALSATVVTLGGQAAGSPPIVNELTIFIAI